MTEPSNAVDPEDLDDLAEKMASLGGRAYRKVAMLLAVCLAATREELRYLVSKVWANDRDAIASIDALIDAPFVERTAAGWRVTPAYAPYLVRRFMNEDPQAFRQAHQLLVDREDRAISNQSESRDLSDMEEWFVKGRLAFYLAGLQAEASVTQFGHAFESAPQRELSSSRRWLSELALRQAPMLADHRRVLEFFEGFSAYVSGRAKDACESFARVIEDRGFKDIFQAIGLHLYGTCINADADRIATLKESVTLSERLGLRENEIMARNSLIAAHVRVATTLTKQALR